MKKTITFLLLALSFQMSAQCWQKIASNSNRTIAIKADGTLWGWGADNTPGGLTIGSNVPVQIGTDSDWNDITTGFSFSVAKKTNGTIWSWGTNTSGELGTGAAANAVALSPTQIGTDTWLEISAGSAHCIGVKSNGSIWSWGANSSGQLGIASTVSKNVPVSSDVFGNTWQHVAAGGGFSLAIRADGTLWSWGSNSSGQLGSGDSVDLTFAQQVGTATDWSSVSGGDEHSVGLKADGSMWTWGDNSKGQLFNGSFSQINFPVQVAAGFIKAVAGYKYTLAVSTTGQLFAFGSNLFGQLGTDSPDINSTLVGADTDWQTAYAGYYTSVALKTDGSLYAWGLNANGEIGDGTYINKSQPVSIACPSGLGVIKTNVIGLNAYPNPVKDILNISFNAEISTVAIFNLLGQKVLTKSLNANEGNIDLSLLRTGTYLVKVQSGTEVKTVKIIKS